MIAALFVHPDGVYADVSDVDLWPESRDARRYDGPHAVIAHPPCARWGKYWHGSPRKPHQFTKGDDAGCFAAALASVRRYGGVLEHPAYSHAWFAHGLPWPPATGGWQMDVDGSWCCQVEQGHYGHASRKPTWLYAVTGGELPDLVWEQAAQRLDERLVERKGYEYARRCGIIGLSGGKLMQRREATPPAFRDVLLSIARSAEASSAVGKR